MSMHITWEENGVILRFEGDLSDDALLLANKTLYVDPRFESIRYQLCDFSNVQTFSVSARVIRQVAKEDTKQAARNPNSKIAIIGKDMVLQGLAKMYAMGACECPWPTECFDTEDQARQWVMQDKSFSDRA